MGLERHHACGEDKGAVLHVTNGIGTRVNVLSGMATEGEQNKCPGQRNVETPGVGVRIYKRPCRLFPRFLQLSPFFLSAAMQTSSSPAALITAARPRRRGSVELGLRRTPPES